MHRRPRRGASAQCVVGAEEEAHRPAEGGNNVSMDYIRKHYGVPAKRGGRVRTPSGKLGTIVGSRGQYLRVRSDGYVSPIQYHPLDVVYLDAPPKEDA